MIETEQNTFNEMIKIHKLYTNSRTKHLPWTKSSNFEEFKKVYNGVLGGNVPRTKSQISLRKITRIPTHSIRNARDKTKIDLKIVHLEMPPLGTEQAIVVPLKKKPNLPPVRNAVKQSSTEKSHTLALAFVQKLREFDKNNPRRKASSNVLKKHPTECIVDAHQEIDIAEKQLEEIRELINKRSEEKRKVVRPAGFKRKPATRHTNCATKNYLSTLMSMQKKLRQLEDKYFNKPKIVYKSVQDTFTQSSDVKIIYENSKYPENAHLEETLKNIMYELDDIANVEATNEPSSEMYQEKEQISMLSTKRKPIEKVKVTDYIRQQLRPIEEIENVKIGDQKASSIRNFVHSIPSISKSNLQDVYFNDIDDDINYESSRSCVPRNLSFMKPYCTYFGNTKDSASVASSSSKIKDITAATKSKSDVGFEEASKIISSAKKLADEIAAPATLSSGLSLQKIMKDFKKHKTSCSSKILRDKEDVDVYYNYGNVLDKEKFSVKHFFDNKSATPKVKKFNVSDIMEKYRRKEEADKHASKIKIKPDDSVFALLDDTKANLDELMTVRQEVYKNLENNNLATLPNFTHEKPLNDVYKHPTNIDRDEIPKYRPNIRSFKISNNFGKRYEYADPIAETIDKSEAQLKKLTNIDHMENVHQLESTTNITSPSLKKYRDIKQDLSKVKTVCNELTHIINEDTEKKDMDVVLSKTTKNEGGGDECGIFDGTGLQKSVVKSCYLMKEFDIKPNIKFFREQDGNNASKKSFEAHTETVKANGLLNMDQLKKQLDSVLENSIFSFASEE